MPLLKKSDIPEDILAEITAELQKRHPGKRIVFPGDEDAAGADFLRHQAIENELRSRVEKSANGRCFDCGTFAPNFIRGQKLPSGWSFTKVFGVEDDLPICPSCSGKEDGLVETPQWWL